MPPGQYYQASITHPILTSQYDPCLSHTILQTIFAAVIVNVQETDHSVA